MCWHEQIEICLKCSVSVVYQIGNQSKHLLFLVAACTRFMYPWVPRGFLKKLSLFGPAFMTEIWNIQTLNRPDRNR